MLRYLFLGIMLARNLQAYSLIDEGKMMIEGQSTYGVLKPYMLYTVRIGSFSDVLLSMSAGQKMATFLCVL